MKKPILALVSITLAACCCMGLVAWGAFTVRNISKSGRIGAWALDTNLMSRVHSDLLSKACPREAFVDINGGWMRLIGRRMCNNILRLDDGRLVEVTPRRPTKHNAERVDAFARWCARNEVNFLYVLCPYKMDRQKTGTPVGAPQDFKDENADEFLANVPNAAVLDLRPHLASSAEDLKRNFFRTDHHWSFAGAFNAFPVVAERLLAILGEKPREIAPLQPEAWEQKPFGRSFLGTHGRRTGPYFGGTDDDVTYFVPRFPTDVVSSIPARWWAKRGNFECTLMNKSMLEKPPSHYLDSGYSLYGGDSPLARNYNPLAPVKKRILVLKDSYALPVCAFLSTVFSEVVLMDLRYYRDMTPMQYVDMTRPDCVCVMHNVRTLPIDWKHFQFGNANAAVRTRPSLVRQADNLEIGAQNSAYNYAMFCSGIKPGSKLRLSVGAVSVRQGSCAMAQALVFNWREHVPVVGECLGTDVGEAQTVYFSVPRKNADYRLLLYAGMPGKTAGNAVVYRDVRLEEM